MLKRLAWIAVAAGLLGACGPSDDFGAEGAEGIDSIDQAVRVTVPARIQAEAYDRARELTPASNSGGHCNRNDGVDMELTTDPNGGVCNVGWTDAGEWLEYDISVPNEAVFNIIARVASAQTGRAFHIELDGTNLGQLSAPSGGWQSWQDRTWVNIRIGAGNHTLRVVFDNGLVNLNYIELTQNPPTCNDGIKNGNETGVDCGGSCTACASSCQSVALNRSSATASSVEPGTDLTPNKAIDGQLGTRWSSAFADNQWITVDLGASRRVNRVVLRWEAAYTRAYDLQVSSTGNAPWTNVFSTESGDGGVDDISFDTSTRYVRVNARTRATGWGNSLFEVEVYGDNNPNCSTQTTPTCSDGIKNGSETDVDCGGSTCPKCANGKLCSAGGDCTSGFCSPTGVCAAAPSCTDGVQNGNETGVDCGGSCPPCQTGCVEQALARAGATASSVENASFPPGNAIDASLQTRWSSAFSDPQWIVVDLGATRRVSRVLLTWETAASADYDIEISAGSGGPWTLLRTVRPGDGGVDDLSGFAGVGRYVRMYSRARNTPWGNSLFDFAVFGDNNPNCTGTGGDSDGDRLPDSAETNTGVFVSATNTGTNPNNPDTDADGLPDGDEVLGTTAGLNLPAMGTSPLRKNILLEYDWFDDSLDCSAHTHRPDAASIARLSQAFADAPVPNPDGSTGITLINDYGQGGPFTGGNLINDGDGIVDGLGAEFFAYKAVHFASNREGYFHYVINPHQYNNRSNFSSGLAFFNGSDMIVSLQCFLNTESISNTIMHELGHNLGLNHGGPLNSAPEALEDDRNFKPNYASVMNYEYQFSGIDVDCVRGGDGVLDYSRKVHIDLFENALNESNGMCGGVDIDWNGNGLIQSSVSQDVNFDGVLTELLDHDDWANLFYDFAPSAGAGAALMTTVPQIAICDNPVPRP